MKFYSAIEEKHEKTMQKKALKTGENGK